MVNQIISAARYNNIQGRIDSIVGIGSGNKGYNNALSSSTVPVSELVRASHMNNLHTDFTKAYVHQLGSNPTTIYTVTSDNEITESLYSAYETLITTIETNRFLVDPDHADLESAGINSSRTALWGGASDPQYVQHAFTVSFANANARRGFFNAGGQIQFSAGLVVSIGSGDPNYAKSIDWANMLSAMGVISFTYNSTYSSTGSGVGSSLGNLSIDSSWQTCYTKVGSGVYVDNEYTVEVKENSSSQLAFRVTFRDDANGLGGADERVSGTLSSSIQQYRATGSYISTPTPAYANTTTL